MTDCQTILRTVAEAILCLSAEQVVRVGIDGVDGAGKSVFSDELVLLLIAAHRRVICASVDGFHNPSELRYRLGRQSLEGYFLDSYDYALLKAILLDPLSAVRDGRYGTGHSARHQPQFLPLDMPYFA